PDGFHANELRNLPLWYRCQNRDSVLGKGSPEWAQSAAGPGGSAQGDCGQDPTDNDHKQNPGNCPATPTGGVEFWYKPESDWFVRQKQWSNGNGDPNVGFAQGPTQIPSEGTSGTVDSRLCGFISATTCTINKAVTQQSWGRVQPNIVRPSRGTQ